MNSRPMSSFAAVLMAGGRSVRMGRDKACLDWHGRPLWQLQAEKLLGIGADPVVVACRREQGLHETAGFIGRLSWRFDPEEEETGPAGVVVRMLDEFRAPVLLLAVDMPFMTPAFLNQSIVGAAQPGQGLFFESKQGLEPLAGWYAPGMLPVMFGCIAGGRTGLRAMIHECCMHGLASLHPLAEAEEALFANLNTPAHWESAVAASGSRDL
ncbi:MAG: Molybdenum cofactor guanylyltransferase [Prosthecobacter sp.]|nr:Molybdenum cofactor guanylyltransferase [Prosthecobacter sp.]